MSKLVIDEGRCKGCALCTIACSKGLLKLGDHLNQYGYLAVEMVPGREAECTACALCAQMCPDVAITIFREAKGGKS